MTVKIKEWKYSEERMEENLNGRLEEVTKLSNLVYMRSNLEI